MRPLFAMNTPASPVHRQHGFIGRTFALALLLLFVVVVGIVFVAWSTLSQVDHSAQNGALGASQPQTVEVWTPNGSKASGPAYIPTQPPPASIPAAGDDVATAVPETPKKPKPAAPEEPIAGHTEGEVPLQPVNTPTEVKPTKPKPAPGNSGGGALDDLF